MRTSRLFILGLFLLMTLFLSGCKLPFVKTKKAALQVLSEPKATVFLNDSHVGQTPYYDDQLKPEEYTLKLVPEGDGVILTWQGIIKLSPNILTVVDRNLGKSEDGSSGYILNLEPIGDKEKAKISVISTPDGVVVNLDGEPKGFTPLSLEDVAEGERVLTISSPGFKEQVVKAKAVKGYKLMIDVQLAREEEEKEEEEKEATSSAEEEKEGEEEKEEIKEDKEASPGAEMERPYVKIKETPTGWLNVRSEPSAAGKEETIITKIDPGEVYKFIESNDSGWYKIEYETGKQGWISGKYVTLYK